MMQVLFTKKIIRLLWETVSAADCWDSCISKLFRNALNEKYLNYGRAAALTDDAVNYIPARLSALLMTAAASLLGLDAANALRIWRRDRRKHASPNSAQTESVVAGALHVALAGDARYFGKWLKKERIGDDDRPVTTEDIRRTNRMMAVSAFLMLALILIVRIAVILGGRLYAAI